MDKVVFDQCPTLDSSSPVQVFQEPGIGPVLFAGLTSAADVALVAAPGSQQLNAAQVLTRILGMGSMLTSSSPCSLTLCPPLTSDKTGM